MKVSWTLFAAINDKTIKNKNKISSLSSTWFCKCFNSSHTWVEGPEFKPFHNSDHRLKTSAQFRQYTTPSSTENPYPYLSTSPYLCKTPVPQHWNPRASVTLIVCFYPRRIKHNEKPVDHYGNHVSLPTVHTKVTSSEQKTLLFISRVSTSTVSTIFMI